MYVFMAVGLNILFLILTTPVFFSFVQYGNKHYDDVLKLMVIHHHGKVDGFLCEFFNVLSGYALHVNSSPESLNRSAFCLSSSFSIRVSRSSFRRNKTSLK